MSEAYDVLVIGGGPAGIAALVAAAEDGCRTAIVESRDHIGGQIWRGSKDPRHMPKVARHCQALFKIDRFEFIGNASVFAAPAPGVLLAEVAAPQTPPRTIELRYKRLVLATGARELFLPFPGWTLPNVVGPGGLAGMAKEGWPVAGKRIVIAGSGPLLLAAAITLKEHGAKIVAIAEQAPFGRLAQFSKTLLRHPSKLSQALAMRIRLAGTPYHTGTWPMQAVGDGATDGISNGASNGAVRSVVLTNGRRTWSIDCDYMACAFGLVPNIELPQMLGCKIADGFVAVDEHQQTSVEHVYAAGELTGIGGAELALSEGELAGIAADPGWADTYNVFGTCEGNGFDSHQKELFARRAKWRRFAVALREAFQLRDELKHLAAPDTIICRCEDVRRQTLDGQPSWQAAKLQTRCGMGPCQGRICGQITEHLYGWTNDSIRPPAIAVSVGALAGEKSK